MINLKTKELTAEQESDRVPIDLICVIDISGSMCGKKLELVKNTLVTLTTLLNQFDRLCLVQFDDRADRLTPLIRISKENIEKILFWLDYVNVRLCWRLNLCLAYPYICQKSCLYTVGIGQWV